MASHPDVPIPGRDPSDVVAPSDQTLADRETSDLKVEDIPCITCDSLKTYTDLSEGYIEAISLALYDPVLTVLASLVGLWVVVSGLQIWLAMTMSAMNRLRR